MPSEESKAMKQKPAPRPVQFPQTDDLSRSTQLADFFAREQVIVTELMEAQALQQLKGHPVWQAVIADVRRQYATVMDAMLGISPMDLPVLQARGQFLRWVLQLMDENDARIAKLGDDAEALKQDAQTLGLHGDDLAERSQAARQAG